MSFVKYRVKEVAADFGVAPKEITEIIGKFYEKPKSNTQVLSDAELNVVFDYMTQKHQIQSMEQVFAVKPAAPKAEPKQEAAPKAQTQGKQPAGRPQNQNQNANHSRPQQGAAQAAQPVKAEKPKAAQERPRERKLKFSFKEQREFETIDAVLAELEEKLAACRRAQEACGSDYVRLQELTDEQERLSAELDEKTERWVYLNDLKEKIDAQNSQGGSETTCTKITKISRQIFSSVL